MLQSIRIFITLTLFMGALLAPAIGLAIAGTPHSPNPALFIAGMAMMTPAI